MGRVRGFDYEAVIGIGGIGWKAKSAGISGKLNWIGIGPHKCPPTGDMRGPLVTFSHFLYFEPTDAPEVTIVMNLLANRLYARHAPRYLLNDFSNEEQAEIERLLKMAKNAPSSQQLAVRSNKLQLCPKPRRKSVC